MDEKDIVELIKGYVLKHLDTNDIHGFSHTKRVYELCLNLGRKENADLKILKIAALLHDVGRIQEKNDALERNHAEISAEIAKHLLTSNQHNLTQNEIGKIIHCIQAHSYSNKLVPETLEAKILSDADKLDALGAIGLYRTIGFTISRNGDLEDVIEHLENKILLLKNRLFLDISKEIAKSREKIIVNFYNKIKEQK